MPMYQYIKAYPRPKKRRPYGISIVFMLIGMIMLLWVGWPIFSFLVFTAPFMVKTVSPVPEGSGDLGGIIDPGGIQDSGYTNPNIWFPARPQKKQESRITRYALTIPKLKIIDANVTIAGDDLRKSLIHYGGTSLPGEYGNAVIFGHSTLVQLFNPKDYKTIFSTLPTIKPGDSIYVTVDGVQYRYVVYDMTVTDPNDLSSLEQRFDSSYLTLITCVPPGTYLKRLNVKAKLAKI